MKFLHKTITLFALFALLLTASPPQPAYAATITVTNNLDSGAGSLRQAIADASSGDTINFAGDYSITLLSTLTINKDLAIDGSGHAITISGGTLVQVMNITSGTVLLNALTIANGFAYLGGGIHNDGTLTVTNSTLFNNFANQSDSSGYGGGIYNDGTLTVTDCTFSQNSAITHSGGIQNNGTLTVTNSNFIENKADSNNSKYGQGGGIHNNGTLTVTGSTFFSNSAVDGGGILNNYGALLEVTNSTFSGNIASKGGSIAGGSILTVTDSTFSGNSANNGFGGSIYHSGGTLTVTGSTFSGNSADSGGGIFNKNSTLTVNNSTFSGNSAINSGGGILNDYGTLHLQNSVLANSASGTDCYNTSSDSIATNINNLIETNAPSGHMCGTPALTADPILGALADNGGDTETHALLTGSPAIDAGDNASCEATDQRGVTRPQGPACDIGAYELLDTILPIVTINQGSSQSDPTNTSPIVFDVVFSEDVTGFTNADVDIAGMASAATITVTSTGTGDTYTVEVSGMADGETVTATIPANAAQDSAGNDSEASTSTDNSVTYDITSIVIITDGTIAQPSDSILQNSEIYYTQFTSLEITFNTEANNPAGNSDPDDITNPDNFLLIQAGANAAYDTNSCLDYSNNGNSVLNDDVQIPTGAVSYDLGTSTATVGLNNGTPLSFGEYRLLVCGTTSITDLAGNALNNGADSATTFTIASIPSSLPTTGFRHGQVTQLSQQPTAKAYTETAMMLDIPKLGVSMPIVGVPQSDSGWDVTWLGNSAGYLAGSAFPTWAGNTVITGHVWDAWNQPGIFSDLKTLKYGDQVQIQAWGLTYTYEVRESNLVTAKNVSAVLQFEEYDWVTLVTCEFYNPFTGDYLFRRAVRAVLVSVK